MIKPSAVQWNKYHVFRDRDEEVVVFPIKSNGSTAFTVLNQDGRVKKTKNHVTSKLIVSKNSKGELTAVVGTFIYDQNYARDFKAELDTLGYLFEGSHYSGYFLTSRLDGLMLLGRNLKRGKANFAFRWRSGKTAARETEQIHLYIGLNEQGATTRSALAEQETDGEYKCSFCHKPADECHCAEVIICGTCKKKLSPGETCSCNKCSTCGFPNKECNCCKRCGNNMSQCICNRPSEGFNNPEQGGNSGNNNYNGSSSSGNSGGQSSNSGGSSTGGNYSGSGYSGIGGPSITPQKPNPFGLNKVYFASPGKIMSAANTTVEKYKAKRYKDDSGRFLAYCNKGVQDHFQQMFPGHHPPGMSGKANQMVKDWRKSSKHWGRIGGEIKSPEDLKKVLKLVQECVNAGLYVVAGWQNPNPDKSGHVVVVLPGQPRRSRRWGIDMPLLMDTGRDKRGTHYYLDDSFGKDKILKVEFYYYKN